MSPRLTAAIAACVLFLANTSTVHPCGFVESAGTFASLHEDASTSHVILIGTLKKSTDSPNPSSELEITGVIKTDPRFDTPTVVRVARHIPAEAHNSFLIFAEVFKGELDFFAVIHAPQALIDYVKGGLLIDGKDRIKLMRYCFDFLEHEDSRVAGEAFEEFIRSTDPDIRKAARSLSPAKLRSFLQSQHTPPARLRLYAFLLANCSDRHDAALLRNLLERLVQESSPTSLIDGVLTAYTLLDPKEGWAYTRTLLEQPTTSFMVRYSGLRAARYFYTSQRGVISERDILSAVAPLLEQGDIADIPILYLRRWKCWDLTDQVLAMFDKQGFAAPIIRRSIVCYALECPHADANRLVAELRQSEPALVRDNEELLKAEAESQRVP